MTEPGGRDRSGLGGIYAILIVIVILLIAGFFWFTGRQDEPDLEIDVDTPEEVIPGTGDQGGGR